MKRVTWKHLLGGTAVTLVALTGLIGFAHTPRGRALRPLLFAVNRVAPGANRAAVAAVAAVAPATPGATDGSCPLGYDKGMSLADVEAQRMRQVASNRGSAPAPAKPALGFSLGTSVRADVQRWASDHHVTCTTPRGPVQIVCTKVAPEALPASFAGLPIAEVFFQFDPADRLVAVGTARSTMDAALAVRISEAVDRELAGQLGTTGKVLGERDAAFLQGATLRHIRTEYRFVDYYASTSVMNMGGGRLSLSERFELLTTGS